MSTWLLEKLLHDAINIMMGQEDGLTEIEKKQAERYIEENPDFTAFYNGLFQELCECANKRRQREKFKVLDQEENN